MFGHRHHSYSGPGERGRPGGAGGGFFGAAFGGLRGGGPGMRMAKMLVSGDLQLIILLLLSQKPRHGYEIIKAIEEHASGVYAPSPGMVYPALTYLEEMAYAAAASDGTKRLYTITDEGSAHLGQNQAAATEVWNQLAIVGRKLAQFQRQFAQDEDVADHFGSGSGGAPGAGGRSDWKQMKSEFRELRDEMKAAIFEKINASVEEKRRVLDILRRAIDEIRKP
jgi:DNA-binding PadR family transcriptional regulator